VSEAPGEATQTESHYLEAANEKPGSLWVLWSVIALLLAYPLSVGPVALAYKNTRPPNFVPAIYAPLEYAYHNSAFAHRALDWYLKLWGTR
jgi:hypothetical protein